MSRRTQFISIFPASGGIQTANNPALISIQNLSDMDNLIFTNDASRRTRPGRKRFDDAASLTEVKYFKYIKDFWRYNSASGSRTNRVVCVVNGKVFADDGGNGVFTDITGSFIIPPTDAVTMDIFSNILIMAFENIVPKMWNHSGNIVNLAGYPPNGSIYRTHAGYGWLAGIKGDPDTIYKSDADNPQEWLTGSAESILISDGDGDPDGVMALFPTFYEDMYVAKRRALYRLRMDSTGNFGISLMLAGMGCISHNSVVALQNDIIFCSERGVHSLSATQKYGDVESAFLSAPIHNIYSEQLDFIRSKQMNACYIPEFNSYMLTFPKRGSSTSKDVLGYNIINGQWYQFKGVNAQFMTQFIDSRKKTRLMTGDADGKVSVFDFDQKTDYGTDAINSSFKTGIIYPLGPNRVVNFKSLMVVFKPQGDSEFIVKVTIDGNDTNELTFDQKGADADNLGADFILGTARLGRKGVVKTQVRPLSGQGRGIQLKFERNPAGSDINQGIEVYGYIVEFLDSEYSDEKAIQ